MRYPICLLAVFAARAALAQGGETARAAITHALPALDGNHLTATIIEVTYAPGGSSVAHRHPCPVIGYVISGALRSRAGDAPESTYTAGQTFYEAPNSLHSVSANASTTQPVTFLAYFVCDHKTPLTVSP
jgi:quercetin dioxygenase-like cupin family protein